MILVYFQEKPLNMTLIHVYAPTINAKEAQQLYEDQKDLIELIPKKMSFSSQGTRMQKEEVKRYMQ